MKKGYPTRLALFLQGLASCALLAGIIPLLFAIVWVLVLGRFDPKFGKWGAFQINCFMIGAVTASVLLAYILSFWPVVCIGAVEKPLQIVVIGFVGCRFVRLYKLVYRLYLIYELKF